MRIIERVIDGHTVQKIGKHEYKVYLGGEYIVDTLKAITLFIKAYNKEREAIRVRREITINRIFNKAFNASQGEWL